jgi:ankyrin repeat protein
LGRNLLHTHQAQPQAIITFTGSQPPDIQRYSPILCFPVEIPRSCKTPICQASRACSFCDTAGRGIRKQKFIYHNGARLDVCGDAGSTLLHSPAWYGGLEMVQVSLDYKIDVNTRKDGGWAPLHDASNGDRFTRIHNVVQSLPDTFQILLERGTDVNMRALNNSTPLRGVMENRSVEIVRMLLEYDANVGAKDNIGRALLHKAAKYGRDEVVSVLLKHGANAGAKDYEGRTLFQLALVEGQGDCEVAVGICQPSRYVTVCNYRTIPHAAITVIQKFRRSGTY